MPLKQEYLTTAERIAQALRQAIADGELAAGAPVRQADIAAQHAVSRMPVREAFRLLEAEGLVVIYPNRGAFVTALSPAEVQEIYDIRILLESEALRRAWPSLGEGALHQAEAILGQLDREPDSAAWSQLDEAFHACLYSAADRPRLLDLILRMRRQVNHIFYLTHQPRQFRAAIQREHRRLLAACRAGDLGAATAALVAHLQNSGSAVAAARAPAPHGGQKHAR